MTGYDWGVESAEAYFGLARSFKGIDSDDPRDLPAVAEAITLGYEPATEAPMYCYLPAIWPVHARAWVRDNRVRHATSMNPDGTPFRLPWSTADYFEIEADYNGFLATCGVPPRPAGRVWLLKPPPGFADLDSALLHLGAAATAAGLELGLSAESAALARGEIARLFGKA